MAGSGPKLAARLQLWCVFFSSRKVNFVQVSSLDFTQFTNLKTYLLPHLVVTLPYYQNQLNKKILTNIEYFMLKFLAYKLHLNLPKNQEGSGKFTSFVTNTFVSEAEGLSSILRSVKSDTALPAARHRCDTSSKEAGVLPGCNNVEMGLSNSLDASAYCTVLIQIQLVYNKESILIF